MKYINLKSSYGIETVDQLSEKDFLTYKDFLQEFRRLLSEYRLAGMAVYSSNRSTKEWRKK
jgi:hypothetical protein